MGEVLAAVAAPTSSGSSLWAARDDRPKQAFHILLSKSAALVLVAVVAVGVGMVVDGCEEIPPSRPMVEIGSMPPPAGWIDYCRRHVEDSGCR